MTDHPDDGDAADGQDETAAIAIRLDALLSERQMTLTELSDRVGVTIVNLSVSRTAAPGRSASAPWPGSAAPSIASQATCCATTPASGGNSAAELSSETRPRPG